MQNLQYHLLHQVAIILHHILQNQSDHRMKEEDLLIPFTNKLVQMGLQVQHFMILKVADFHVLILGNALNMVICECQMEYASHMNMDIFTTHKEDLKQLCTDQLIRQRENLQDPGDLADAT
jgi:hypothetical protein